jgi:hypothetical protein
MDGAIHRALLFVADIDVAKNANRVDALHVSIQPEFTYVASIA